jgi:branched-chain amino acid transport system substrate-binding protein
MTVRGSALLIGTPLAAPSSLAVATSADVVRDVASRVPSVAGHSGLVLEYKAASAKYAAGEAPGAMSLEGYISASIRIQALKQTNPLDTERLVDTLEAMRSLDLGTPLAFGRAAHQTSHRFWETALNEARNYQAIELE